MKTLEHEHTTSAIAERLSTGPGSSYLRDWIYGGIDGAVTTFAVVTGVAGAQLSSWVVLVLGFANLFADGFSMAAANFLATRAEHEDLLRLEAIEHRHIDATPEGEREEVRHIFKSKGFAGDDLNRVVELITSDRERWVQTMLREEYGLAQQVRSEWVAALSTFTAFLICGLVPLLPYLFPINERFSLSAVTTLIVFFAIGSLKSRWSTARWWSSGFVTCAVGTVAAALAYTVGLALKGFVK